MSVQPSPVALLQVPSTAGKSASNAAWAYWLAPVVGLLNWNGVGWLEEPFGQSRWYEAPSNPVLVNVQPFTWTASASLPGKQKMSSLSGGVLFRPRPSKLPLGHATGLPCWSRPNGVAGIGCGPVQNWKWP